MEEIEVPKENHRPAASHWQTVSHNIVSSTPRLSGIRTHNITGAVIEVNVHLSTSFQIYI